MTDELEDGYVDNRGEFVSKQLEQHIQKMIHNCTDTLSSPLLSHERLLLLLLCPLT